MLYDFIVTDKSLKIPMYRQIYLSIRKAIESGSLKKGTQLISIRKLSENLGVSKTTVIAAYEQLSAEGYINTKPQSGYFVAAQFDGMPDHVFQRANRPEKSGIYYEYDFSGKSTDNNIIDISEWKKNIKDVINRNYLLTSYGDVQGEAALRLALQKYALGIRGVNSSADNIIVGAGTQTLLYLLCSIIGQNKTLAMDSNTFVQSEFVFKSFGYNISYFENDKYGATVASLEKIKPEIILINPNFTCVTGENMPVSRRLEIIEWAKRNNALIIEDDYNGELRYSTHPMPCAQNYDVDNIVYIGSFSKVLLPSVRISYMVLPARLMPVYNNIKALTNQPSSKTEQLALAEYINSGKIDAHLRKARRIYLEKSKKVLKCLTKYFPNARIIFNETSLYVSLRPESITDLKSLKSRLEKNSIAIMPHHTDNELGISFSGISTDKIEDGLKKLSELV